MERASDKAGMTPGSLLFVGEKRVDKPVIRRISYTPDGFRDEEYRAAAEAFPFDSPPAVTWLDVVGLHDTANIERVGTALGIHPLVLEDVLHTGQRPKVEDYGDYLYVVMKTLAFDRASQGFNAQQLSFVIGHHFVITFREKNNGVFASLVERLGSGRGRVRARGADYLGYALLDVIIDGYFEVLEQTGEVLESLEASLMGNPGQEVLNQVYTLQREAVSLRRYVWGLREAMMALQKVESGVLSADTQVFLRDLYDHTLRILDTVETHREMTALLLQLFMSSSNNRMTEVMKTLTIIATIFIPLTFIVGVYGMNFTNMPELHWEWGYFGVLGLMLATAFCMLVFFRRKNWF